MCSLFELTGNITLFLQLPAFNKSKIFTNQPSHQKTKVQNPHTIKLNKQMPSRFHFGITVILGHGPWLIDLVLHDLSAECLSKKKAGGEFTLYVEPNFSGMQHFVFLQSKYT